MTPSPRSQRQRRNEQHKQKFQFLGATMPEWRLINGFSPDAYDALEPQSVAMVATSPPYFGLRANGCARVWPDANHEHEWVSERYYDDRGHAGKSTLGFSKPGPENAKRLKEARWREHTYCVKCATCNESHDWQTYQRKGQTGGTKSKKVQVKGLDNYSIVPDQEQAICRRCRAWYGELGQEPDPELYIQHLADCLDAVRGVLRKDGSLWVVIGDSYAGSGRGPTGHNGFQSAERRQGFVDPGAKSWPDRGIKPKDLIGVPWMLAFEMRRRGWWWRQDIVWSKPNPMPSSVRDRCTRAHETILHFTKSARYYWDADAIREPYAESSAERYAYGFNKVGKGLDLPQGASHSKGVGADGGVLAQNAEGKNKRSVWQVATRPYPGQHTSTYPEKLIAPMILATSRPGDLILDPFGGASSTGVAALELGRRYVGIEPVGANVDQSHERLMKAARASISYTDARTEGVV